MSLEQDRPVASAHMLLRAAAYLSAALAVGLCLMLAWPQGGVCASSCGARLEAGAQTVAGLAAAGFAGLVAALWLGIKRRSAAPVWLVVGVTAALAGALAIVAASASGSADPDATGLAAARGARAWVFALPALALLVAESCAALAEGRRGRAATLASTALGGLGCLLVAAVVSAG